MASIGTDTAKAGGRIVVVGAGIVGCCAAYHLLRAGAREVTVVDAVPPGGATTSAGAGFVSHWSAGMLPQFGAPGLRLQQYGLDFYKALHGLGTEIGYRPTGTLMMALTEAGFERFVRPVLDSPFAPPEMRRLDAAGIGEIMGGLVDAREVYAAAYNPHGIQVDTGLATELLAAEVQRLGGELRTGTRVEDLRAGADGVRVVTDRGELAADRLLLTGGAWTNELLAMLGRRLPLLRMVATRIVTDDRSLPSTLPTVQCRELRLWLRESFGAVTWGTVDGYAPLYRLGSEGEAPLPHGKPRVARLLERLLERQHSTLEPIFPPLHGSQVASWEQGVPCYTPDNSLLVGPLPGHPNVLVAAGDNETGVSHGPGMGRLLAELALEQASFVDLRPFRLDRLDPAAYPTEAAVEAALAASRDHGAGVQLT